MGLPLQDLPGLPVMLDLSTYPVVCKGLTLPMPDRSSCLRPRHISNCGWCRRGTTGQFENR